MNSDKSLIEIVSLSALQNQEGYITPRMIEVLEENKKNHKKTLLFYNRRGNARAWICEDCGHFEKCPNCDIAFAYHTSPKKRLMCHHCNMILPCPIVCPVCQGSRIVGVGIGIEQLTESLKKVRPESRIFLLDADHKNTTDSIFLHIEQSDIIVSTKMGIHVQHPDIAAVFFVLFELNLSLPEYDLEEDMYSEIAYFKKQHIPLYIQSYTPEHPLLQLLVFGNYREYLSALTKERKDFLYPPYADYATIRVHHPKKEWVQVLVTSLYEQAKVAQQDMDTFIACDRDIWEKYRGEWSQKIILKGRGVSDILDALKSDIIRNRSVYVEWH